MDGGILANKVSCSLISSNINTWTSAAPGTRQERTSYSLKKVLPGSLHTLDTRLNVSMDLPPMMLCGSSALARRMFGPNTVAKFWQLILLMLA